MAKSIYEDAEALDALHYCRRFTDIFRTLRCYDYLADMTLEEYVETALKAADDLKYFLDPDTGNFSEDAVSNADEAAFKGSFQQHHDLILQLIGISDGPALFPRSWRWRTAGFAAIWNACTAWYNGSASPTPPPRPPRTAGKSRSPRRGSAAC